MRFTFIILFFHTVLGFSQEIKYELYLINSCSGKIEKSSFYRLEKNGIEYTNFENGIITLSEKGKYKLTAIEFEEERIVSIKKTINSDTIKTPKIVEFVVTHTEPNYLFRKCDKLCNGIETDYYPNGFIRIKGEFKNGVVIGELKRYYQNGKIKEVSIYDNDGILIKKNLFAENRK